MSARKKVAWVAVVLAVGHTTLASTLAHDAPGQIARGLQEITSRTSDSERGLCQYAVEYEEEALARGQDPSIPGTTVNVTNLISGRLGNHFTIVSRFLSLGYCCKAKLVTLPPKDPILAPGMFGEGESGPRHFDFSDAPDVPGFNSSSECAADYTLGDYWAYMAFLARSGRPYGNMRQKELALCIRSVRLLQCEAAYYFPVSLDVCEPPDSSSGRLDTPSSVSESNIETAGNLVIHVRSGDVFRYGNAHGTYGQPPLSYYIGVINNRDWDRVDVVTYGADKRDENPVVPALRMMKNIGTWPNTNINIHVDRSIEVDLQAMLCADALAASRSTIGELTMYHTRAKTIFMPSTCDGYGSTFGHTSGRLIAARSWRDESFEVQGVTLQPEAPMYKVYESTEFTDNERLEMLQYSGLAGMEECTSSELDVDRWDSASSSRVPLGNVPP